MPERKLRFTSFQLRILLLEVGLISTQVIAGITCGMQDQIDKFFTPNLYYPRYTDVTPHLPEKPGLLTWGLPDDF